MSRVSLAAQHFPSTLLQRAASRHTLFSSSKEAIGPALLGAAPRIAMLHGASGEQFRRFVDDTTRLVINAMDEEPAARLDTHQPFLGASRHKLIETVWQLVVNGSTDCDMYERRARYRRGFILWKSLLIPLLPEGRRSLARASRAWPSPLRRRLTAALSNSSLRD